MPNTSQNLSIAVDALSKTDKDSYALSPIENTPRLKVDSLIDPMFIMAYHLQLNLRELSFQLNDLQTNFDERMEDLDLAAEGRHELSLLETRKLQDKFEKTERELKQVFATI